MLLSRNILAHRGWWNAPEEKNSEAALDRALRAGFGVETDLRDCDGELVISHDPPRKARNLLTAARFFQMYRDAEADGWLALNVKADGLQTMVKQAMELHGVRAYFMFDMSVPDSLGYLKQDMPIATRHSEVETQPALYDQSQFVWLDCFFGDWLDNATIVGHLNAGKYVAVVSPELHGREHVKFWTRLREIDGEHNEKLMICTDFPQQAKEFFGAQD